MQEPSTQVFGIVNCYNLFMKTKTALQNIFAKQVNSEFYRIPLYNPYFIVLSSPDLRKVISGYLIIIWPVKKVRKRKFFQQCLHVQKYTQWSLWQNLIDELFLTNRDEKASQPKLGTIA